MRPAWRVSAIVTTHNRSDYLRLCMAALEVQTVRPDEVVIADDGSDPEHVRAIEKLMADTSLRATYARQEHRGFRVGANRNNGVRHATGDYVFFVDGDIVLFPDALEQHLAASGRRRWVAGLGVRLTREESSRVTEEAIRARGLEDVWPGSEDPRWLELCQRAASLRRKARRAWLRPSERRFRNVWMITMQASMPRAAFEKVNGFDETFEGWGEEDLDLGLRLQIAGVLGRTVMDRSRALHIYHDRLPETPHNQEYYKRPRHGEFFCPNGLCKSGS